MVQPRIAICFSGSLRVLMAAKTMKVQGRSASRYHGLTKYKVGAPHAIMVSQRVTQLKSSPLQRERETRWRQQPGQPPPVAAAPPVFAARLLPYPAGPALAAPPPLTLPPGGQ